MLWLLRWLGLSSLYGITWVLSISMVIMIVLVLIGAGQHYVQAHRANIALSNSTGVTNSSSRPNDASENSELTAKYFEDAKEWANKQQPLFSFSGNNRNNFAGNRRSGVPSAPSNSISNPIQALNSSITASSENGPFALRVKSNIASPVTESSFAAAGEFNEARKDAREVFPSPTNAVVIDDGPSKPREFEVGVSGDFSSSAEAEGDSLGAKAGQGVASHPLVQLRGRYGASLRRGLVNSGAPPPLDSASELSAPSSSSAPAAPALSQDAAANKKASDSNTITSASKPSPPSKSSQPVFFSRSLLLLFSLAFAYYQIFVPKKDKHPKSLENSPSMFSLASIASYVLTNLSRAIGQIPSLINSGLAFLSKNENEDSKPTPSATTASFFQETLIDSSLFSKATTMTPFSLTSLSLSSLPIEVHLLMVSLLVLSLYSFVISRKTHPLSSRDSSSSYSSKRSLVGKDASKRALQPTIASSTATTTSVASSVVSALPVDASLDIYSRSINACINSCDRNQVPLRNLPGTRKFLAGYSSSRVPSKSKGSKVPEKPIPSGAPLTPSVKFISNDPSSRQGYSASEPQFEYLPIPKGLHATSPSAGSIVSTGTVGTIASYATTIPSNLRAFDARSGDGSSVVSSSVLSKAQAGVQGDSEFARVRAMAAAERRAAREAARKQMMQEVSALVGGSNRS
jgi:hypothetical protein